MDEQVVEKKGGRFGTKGKIIGGIAVLMMIGIAFAGLSVFLSNSSSASFTKDIELKMLINGQQTTVLNLVDNNLDFNYSIINEKDQNISGYQPVIIMFSPTDSNWLPGLPEVVRYSEGGVDLTSNLYELLPDGTQGNSIRNITTSGPIVTLMLDSTPGDGIFQQQVFERNTSYDRNVVMEMHPALSNGEYSWTMQVLQSLDTNN